MRTKVMCTTTAGDEPINISWVKDGMPLSSNNIPTNTNNHGQHGHFGHQPHSHNTNNNSHNKMANRGQHEHEHAKVSIRQLDHFSSILSISPLEEFHSGNYSCLVSNHENSETAIYSAFLRVNGIFTIH